MGMNKNFKLFLIGIFSIFLTLIYFTQTASAASVTIGPYDFDDGITNWSQFTSNQVANIPIDGTNLQLGYAFGLAQDTKGKVSTGGDGTIASDSISSGDRSQYSKVNIFLNQNGNYISSVFQGGYTSTGTNRENVSPSSPDFMIAPNGPSSLQGITSSAYNILGNPSANNNGTGNTGMTSKKYYVGTDANGHPAYKIMGHFTRTNNSGYKNGTYDMEVEILLRASPTNSAIVQREMYVKNLSTDTAEFITLYSEDTKLGDSNGINNDMVPVYDLGNKQGIYVQDTYSGNNYRLFVTNNLPDGFNSYVGQIKSSNWATGFANNLVTGTGAEANNNPKGTLLTGFGDTAYTLKWNPTTLKTNETAHFGSTMGVTAKPYSIMTPEKTYTNETRSDGTNMVGDTLKFNLKITNNGYGAKWNYNKLVDKLPAGLQVDASSMAISNNGGTSQPLDESDYDVATNTITVPPGISLTDDQYATITFKATITKAALTSSGGENTITNTADFSGIDVGNNETVQKTFPVSVDIKVQPARLNYTFTKQVKKHDDTAYSQSVDAKKGAIVDYQIIYSIDSGSTDSVNAGAVLDDVLPEGLKLDTSSIKIWGPGDDDNGGYHQDHISTGVNAIGKGQRVKVEFSATVTATSVGKLTNTATMSNVTTTGNQTFAKQTSTAADVNVQNVDAITQVPTNIDFGSTNMYGQNKILHNVSTLGELVVSHPSNTPYNVTVSYDNDSADSQMTNSNGDTLPTDATGLIFIKQRTDKDTDVGTWTPITPTGTSIQSSNFTDYSTAVNLTNYIGAGNWQLKVSSNTVPGAYNGTLTWGLTESI
ncbi:hypothetical protein CPR19088_GLDEOEPO_01872 [Companilactobacillus paralimentarius]